MVSPYMMNLFKVARGNGIFSQYQDSAISRNPKLRSGLVASSKEKIEPKPPVAQDRSTSA